MSKIEIDYMEYATDGAAQAAYVTDGIATPTGGTITTNGNKTVHTFLLAQTGTDFTVPAGVSGDVDYLVVAGGGGSSNAGHGGGGGGGFRTGTLGVVAGAYTITVGGSAAEAKGGDSIFSSITSEGGGKGGTSGPASDADGGSGGGNSTSTAGGAGTAGQGNDGGYDAVPYGDPYYPSGGGGGAGAAGEDTQSESVGGDGGAGLSSTIYDGSTKWYSGGGGGGSGSGGTAGTGGIGGGGDGNTDSSAEAGTADTGGGAGGSQGGTAQAGGSGIVIISYVTADFIGLQLQSYSEDTIVEQGTYSLKAVAVQTDSLNKTLTKSGLSIDLSDRTELKIGFYASRTGTNIQVQIHDSGGQTSTKDIAISSAGAWETTTWDISGIANADKDDIDSIIIKIINADAANTFYIDNFYAPEVVVGNAILFGTNF